MMLHTPNTNQITPSNTNIQRAAVTDAGICGESSVGSKSELSKTNLLLSKMRNYFLKRLPDLVDCPFLFDSPLIFTTSRHQDGLTAKK
jgi:hypothetical protein